MNEKAYVAGNLRKAVRYRNLIKIDDFKDHTTLESIATFSASDIKSNAIWNGAISNVKVKGKDAWTISEPKTVLAHNLLVSNIQRNYSTRCNDRKFTIQLLLTHIKDSYNYSVHRLDIKSFYESFDRREILRKLKSDSPLSTKSLKVLESLFEELNVIGAKGLPRGLGISSTLSELMMYNFDSNIRSLKEVLFYARFVDDIIVISTPALNKSMMSQKLNESGLPHVLEFHNTGDKVFFSQVEKAPNKKGKLTSFDFLGYEFHIERSETNVGKNVEFKRRNVKVSIAPNKIEKLKKRLISSFCAVLSSNKASQSDILLLNKRLKFLTKNFLLESSSSAPNVYSGIYHNYNFIDQYDGLKELDCFYQNLLFGKRSKLSKRIKRSLSFNTRKGLAKHSFMRGFVEREFCRFSYQDFSDIKKAWS
ncbi:reverse transcriptase domain-containing protein [Pseudoalteromonas sp. ACER1]|uniref:antiviral reverse transcriptase Drt3a n=1 Tax=Pseudoalteromonas sp. ACER1 TaxID=2954495 RepID=UPI0020973F2F|nr:reverse transcriptase domain-containing protein [Pseudoalteromonas sp. ACER1]